MRQNAPDFDIEVALAVAVYNNETMKNDYYIILPNCFDAHIDGRFDRSKSSKANRSMGEPGNDHDHCWQSVIHRWSQLKTLTRFIYIYNLYDLKPIWKRNFSAKVSQSWQCIPKTGTVYYLDHSFLITMTHLLWLIYIYMIYHVYRTSCRTCFKFMQKTWKAD